MNKSILALSLVLTLSACDGGGIPTIPPGEVVTPFGLWDGIVTFKDGFQSNAFGLIAPNNEVRFFLIGDGGSGLLSHQVGTIKHTSNGNFEVPVTEYVNGVDVSQGNLIGTFTDTTMNGRAIFDGVQTSTFQMDESIHSSRPADFLTIAGTYLDHEIFIHIDDQGKITGQYKIPDVVGLCSYTGNLKIFSNDLNIYQLNIRYEKCGELDEYTGTGYGSLIDIYGEDIFIFEISHQDVSVVFALPQIH